MSKNYERPIPDSVGPHAAVVLKLPFGWERDEKHDDRLIIRLPSGGEIPEAVAEGVRNMLGDLGDCGIEALYRLSLVNALHKVWLRAPSGANLGGR